MSESLVLSKCLIVTVLVIDAEAICSKLLEQQSRICACQASFLITVWCRRPFQQIRDHSALDCETVVLLLMRYLGALFICTECMSRHGLYQIRCLVYSQHSCFNAGVTWSNSLSPASHGSISVEYSLEWLDTWSLMTCQDGLAVVKLRECKCRDQLCCDFTAD